MNENAQRTSGTIYFSDSVKFPLRAQPGSFKGIRQPEGEKQSQFLSNFEVNADVIHKLVAPPRDSVNRLETEKLTAEMSASSSQNPRTYTKDFRRKPDFRSSSSMQRMTPYQHQRKGNTKILHFNSSCPNNLSANPYSTQLNAYSPYPVQQSFQPSRIENSSDMSSYQTQQGINDFRPVPLGQYQGYAPSTYSASFSSPSVSPPFPLSLNPSYAPLSSPAYAPFAVPLGVPSASQQSLKTPQDPPAASNISQPIPSSIADQIQFLSNEDIIALMRLIQSKSQEQPILQAPLPLPQSSVSNSYTSDIMHQSAIQPQYHPSSLEHSSQLTQQILPPPPSLAAIPTPSHLPPPPSIPPLPPPPPPSSSLPHNQISMPSPSPVPSSPSPDLTSTALVQQLLELLLSLDLNQEDILAFLKSLLNLTEPSTEIKEHSTAMDSKFSNISSGEKEHSFSFFAQPSSNTSPSFQLPCPSIPKEQPESVMRLQTLSFEDLIPPNTPPATMLHYSLSVAVARGMNQSLALTAAPSHDATAASASLPPSILPLDTKESVLSLPPLPLPITQSSLTERLIQLLHSSYLQQVAFELAERQKEMEQEFITKRNKILFHQSTYWVEVDAAQKKQLDEIDKEIKYARKNDSYEKREVYEKDFVLNVDDEEIGRTKDTTKSGEQEVLLLKAKKETLLMKFAQEASKTKKVMLKELEDYSLQFGMDLHREIRNQQKTIESLLVPGFFQTKNQGYLGYQKKMLICLVNNKREKDAREKNKKIIEEEKKREEMLSKGDIDGILLPAQISREDTFFQQQIEKNDRFNKNFKRDDGSSDNMKAFALPSENSSHQPFSQMYSFNRPKYDTFNDEFE